MLHFTETEGVPSLVSQITHLELIIMSISSWDCFTIRLQEKIVIVDAVFHSLLNEALQKYTENTNTTHRCSPRFLFDLSIKILTLTKGHTDVVPWLPNYFH